MNAPKAMNELAAFMDRMTEARREIAIAKLVEFGRQVDHIAAELPEQWHGRAIDALLEMALANGLVRAHGQELIEQILAAGFK